MPSASALVRARPDQVFLGPRDGNCQNCGVRWGGHAGIRCHTTPYNQMLLCPWCDLTIEDHRIRDCVHHKQALTLPPEFVELWGEIGRAHAAAVYLEPAYVPKVWPKATLQAAKLAGLARRDRELERELGYRGRQVHFDEVASISPAQLPPFEFRWPVRAEDSPRWGSIQPSPVTFPSIGVFTVD